MQAHLKTAQATAQTKVFKRVCKADPKEKLNKKKSNALKKNKKYTTHSRHSMTRQLNNDNGLQAQRTERQHLTAVWQKWRFSAPQTVLWLIKHWFSASTFVVKIATFAKPQNVISKPKRRQCNHQADTKTTRLSDDPNSVDNFAVTRHRPDLFADTQTNAFVLKIFPPHI